MPIIFPATAIVGYEALVAIWVGMDHEAPVVEVEYLTVVPSTKTVFSPPEVAITL